MEKLNTQISLETSINQGWEEMKSAMEGNHNLQTADELLKELEYCC